MGARSKVLMERRGERRVSHVGTLPAGRKKEKKKERKWLRRTWTRSFRQSWVEWGLREGAFGKGM